MLEANLWVLSLVVTILVFLSDPLHAITDCDYYASPIGNGNGLSLSTPFKVSNFWSVAKPGDTLCLLDGKYTGSASMINPRSGLSGTAASPITIQALNDGEATIDGQGINTPVALSGSDYFILEGFNAHSSINSVILIANGSDHNTVRRVVAWNANRNANVGFVISVEHSVDNLIEDCAAFGTGRKVIGSTQYGDHTTIRRCWARWEGSDFIGPKETLTAGYFNYYMTTENFIGTWSGGQMSGATDQPYGVIATDNDAAYSKILGSILYVRSADNYPAGQVAFLQNVHDYTLKDVAVYNEKSSIDTINLGTSSNTAGLSASKITAIGARAAHINSIWNPTNIINASSVANANSQGANLFTGTKGAQVCYRYQDGVLTNMPLWPWPMNQRIIDAMTEAGKTPVDVTATIEQIFGPIPATCKGQSQIALFPPQNLQIIQ
jgi:hypothetical protein